MFATKKHQPREIVSGTVGRIGPFLVVGGSSLTYELMLDGHEHSFWIGAIQGLPPTSRIHLTKVGDAVEFEAMQAEEGKTYRIGVEASFKNHSLAKEKTLAE